MKETILLILIGCYVSNWFPNEPEYVFPPEEPEEIEEIKRELTFYEEVVKWAEVPPWTDARIKRWKRNILRVIMIRETLLLFVVAFLLFCYFYLEGDIPDVPHKDMDGLEYLIRQYRIVRFLFCVLYYGQAPDDTTSDEFSII
jgi:hypothetical protein